MSLVGDWRRGDVGRLAEGVGDSAGGEGEVIDRRGDQLEAGMEVGIIVAVSIAGLVNHLGPLQ